MVKLHLPYTMMWFFLKNLQSPNWIIFCVRACFERIAGCHGNAVTSSVVISNTQVSTVFLS